MVCGHYMHALTAVKGQSKQQSSKRMACGHILHALTAVTDYKSSICDQLGSNLMVWTATSWCGHLLHALTAVAIHSKAAALEQEGSCAAGTCRLSLVLLGKGKLNEKKRQTCPGNIA